MRRNEMDIIIGNMEILKADTFRKPGAGKNDIKMIAELYGKGKTVAQISVILNVQEAVVAAFCPVLAEPPVEMEIAAPAAPVEVEEPHASFFKKDKSKSKR
jgi:hypothetical protein